MYCRSCGKENRDGAKFCSGCGKPLLTPAKRTPPKQSNMNLPIVLIIILLFLILIMGCFFVAVEVFNFKLPSENNQQSEIQTTQNNNGKEDEGNGNGEGNGFVPQNENDELGDDFTQNENFVPSINCISPAYADDRHYYGNSFENISQGGTMVAYGEWIYYSNVNADSTIWRMKPDGSEQSQVFSIPAWHISIYNDWLYYRQLDKGYLCRYNLIDGTDEILVNRDIYEPKVVGNYIYFEDASDNSYDLYRVDVDGRNETKLTDGIVLYCCVADKRIYYLDTAENRKGYSVNLDGKDKQLWYAGRVGTIDYVDGIVYFTDADNGGLYSLDPYDGEIAKISNLTMWSINIYNDDVYYADGKNDGALTKTSLSNPDEKQLLSSDKCELINVCGGWVQYHIQGYDEDEEFYWVSTDGSEFKQF